MRRVRRELHRQRAPGSQNRRLPAIRRGRRHHRPPSSHPPPPSDIALPNQPNNAPHKSNENVRSRGATRPEEMRVRNRIGLRGQPRPARTGGGL